MSYELTAFQHEQFGSIRSIVINHEPWFVAADLCAALEHSNVTTALGRLDGDEKAKFNLGLSGGLTNVVNESGMYELILGSRKKEAKEFKRWIKSEVLPMIRKTGGYVNNDELFVNTYMPYADDGTKAMFLLHLKAQRETNEKLKEMSPKAEYFDRLIDRGSALSMRDTAKSLGIKETALKDLLFDHGYIYRDQKNRIRPYAAKNKGYFVLKEFENDKNGYTSVQTLITVEGREKLLSIIRERGLAQ